jgi:ribosomal protein S18 acetylase RimI-like enzyme
LHTFVKLGRESISTVAKIHIAAFPNFFLTSLGYKVLCVFYDALIKDKATIAWAVEAESKIVGFFVASTQPAGLYTRVFKKHFFSFLFPLLLAFIKRPSLFKRMFISFASQKSHQTPDNCHTSLLSICVDPSFSGKGIGSSMLHHLEDELRKSGKKGYYLTTDADNNESTNQFYLKNEFDLFASFQQGNRKMNLYSKQFA